MPKLIRVNYSLLKSENINVENIGQEGQEQIT